MLLFATAIPTPSGNTVGAFSPKVNRGLWERPQNFRFPTQLSRRKGGVVRQRNALPNSPSRSGRIQVCFQLPDFCHSACFWAVINSAGRELWQLVFLFIDIHGPLPGGQLYFTSLLMGLSRVTCYSMWTVWKVKCKSFKSHCVLFRASFVSCQWPAMSPRGISLSVWVLRWRQQERVLK